MASAIVRDAAVMGGTPVFRGTRVPARTLFDYLEDGETLERFLAGFPPVSRELAIQALEEAKELLLARPVIRMTTVSEKQARDERDIEIINRNAEQLNSEAMDALEYQELNCAEAPR